MEVNYERDGNSSGDRRAAARGKTRKGQKGVSLSREIAPVRAPEICVFGDMLRCGLCLYRNLQDSLCRDARSLVYAAVDRVRVVRVGFDNRAVRRQKDYREMEYFRLGNAGNPCGELRLRRHCGGGLVPGHGHCARILAGDYQDYHVRRLFDAGPISHCRQLRDVGAVDSKSCAHADDARLGSAGSVVRRHTVAGRDEERERLRGGGKGASPRLDCSSRCAWRDACGVCDILPCHMV